MGEPLGEMIVVNIGGEGEIPGALNVNGKWLAGAGWHSIQPGNPTLADLQQAGHQFLLIELHPLPFDDASVDIVYTNNVCLDKDSWLGPCPRTAEIWRILKPGGLWIRDSIPQQRP
jgi:SAM-dependent methyltransferase